MAVSLWTFFGEQVPFANGRVAFEWGDVYQGDLLHQFAPDCESEEATFSSTPS